MEMGLMLDAFIAIMGGYFIYKAVEMKRTGSLAKGIMVSKDFDLSKARDVEGFIWFMFPKTVVVGACAVICGIVGIINDLYGGLAMVQLALTGVFFAVVVVFGYLAVKAQKKFLE